MPEYCLSEGGLAPTHGGAAFMPVEELEPMFVNIAARKRLPLGWIPPPRMVE